MYLTLAMLATREPRHVRPYPAATYARMLDLDDPDGQGPRRVNQAQRWLRDAGYIQRIENGTHPPLITVLPVAAQEDWGGRWITVPIELWSNGGIHVLSGRALAVYVVLRDLTGGRSGGATADGRRKRQYGLSDETWARGVRELQAQGLAVTERIVDRPDAFARGQLRVKYELVPDALRRLPAMLSRCVAPCR